MLVKECMELAAVKLGIEEPLKNYFYSLGSSEDVKKAELLLTCFNIVENELALDYFPLLAEDTVLSQGGVIAFSELEKSAVRIIKVTDEWGNTVPFQLFPRYLKTQPGKVCITYSFAPDKKTETDECDFDSSVSMRLIADGMAAEYSLSMGLFEDAAVWDKKYKEGIRAGYRLQKCERIQSRRWV